MAAGYSPGHGIGTIHVGQWSDANLVSQSVGTFSAAGNPGLIGSVSDSVFYLFGAVLGYGLGAFSTAGPASNSVFRISGGNVGSFTASRFLDSDLLVGYLLPAPSNLTITPASTNWSANVFSIGSFLTTNLFSPANIAQTASFAGSDIVAGKLGTISLSGVDPLAELGIVTFGVAFQNTSKGSKGSVFINGANAPLLFPFTPPPGSAFRYLGQPG